MSIHRLGWARLHKGTAVRGLLLTAIAALVSVGYVHCGATTQLGTVEPKDICNCLPIEPDIADYRHLAKHVPLPNVTPQEITVNDILGWDQNLPILPPESPRSGRERQLYHAANA